MKTESIAADGTSRSWWDALNRFWFTPADPTLLGLIRICCGMITFYTMLVYSFRLPDFVGEYAWSDLPGRLKQIYDEPRHVEKLSRAQVIPASSPEEHAYNVAYFKKWNRWPPLPYPESPEARVFIDQFIAAYGLDPRSSGAPPPAGPKERAYAEEYVRRHRAAPPAYPDFTRPAAEVSAEIRDIDEYIETFGFDPRGVAIYERGARAWSIYFDITDPAGIAFIHGVVVLVTFLFMIGFCTRITSVLTWMFCLWYIHRSPYTLFGVDTMQTILLLYLMIGPSGAALSVDRLIARWWSRNKHAVVNRWRAFWKKPPLSAGQIVPAVYSEEPTPSISANVAYRLLQIHICIIYLIAGLAKMQGSAWWTGTAVWGTLANYEFAPMQYGIYLWFLKQIAAVQWVFYVFLTFATYFTLAFEIGYAFLIWRPALRRWFLAGAILLHGFIGLFMGLKTFSLMMLVMNMAFLTNQEARWLLGWFTGEAPRPQPAPADEAPALESTKRPGRVIPETATAITSRKR